MTNNRKKKHTEKHNYLAMRAKSDAQRPKSRKLFGRSTLTFGKYVDRAGKIRKRRVVNARKNRRLKIYSSFYSGSMYATPGSSVTARCSFWYGTNGKYLTEGLIHQALEGSISYGQPCMLACVLFLT